MLSVHLSDHLHRRYRLPYHSSRLRYFSSCSRASHWRSARSSSSTRPILPMSMQSTSSNRIKKRYSQSSVLVHSCTISSVLVSSESMVVHLPSISVSSVQVASSPASSISRLHHLRIEFSGDPIPSESEKSRWMMTLLLGSESMSGIRSHSSSQVVRSHSLSRIFANQYESDSARSFTSRLILSSSRMLHIHTSLLSMRVIQNSGSEISSLHPDHM